MSISSSFEESSNLIVCRTREAYTLQVMKFMRSHAGKWVATKGEKVVATDTEFGKLRARMETRKDRKMIGYDLVPQGHITGTIA